MNRKTQPDADAAPVVDTKTRDLFASYPPIDWDAPLPAPLPLPEHFSALDEAMDAGQLLADADAAQRLKDAVLELYASRGEHGVRRLLDEVLDALGKQQAQDLAA